MNQTITERPFTDVFTGLTISPELAGLLSDIFVERVILNKSKQFLHVYVRCGHWVKKEFIYELEDAIATQILDDCMLKVQITERFTLSAQYTPEKFFEVYKPSFLLELKQKSPLLHQIMVHTTLRFTDADHVTAVLPSSVAGAERAGELIGVIERVFNERAGFSVHVSRDEEEGVIHDLSLDEEVTRNAVANIVARAEKSRKTDTEVKEEPEKKLPPQEGKPVRRRQLGSSKDPDLILGRPIDGEPTPMCEIADEPGEVIVQGEVFSVEEKETRTGKTIFTIALTDYTDSLRMKLFADAESLDQYRDTFKVGAAFLVRGMMNFDAFDHEVMLRNVYSIKRTRITKEVRSDTAAEKRIELHCHTKMSDMDAVSSVTDIIRQAYEWGHKAIAVTDHGVVQAFPDALHTFGGKHGIPKDADFKIIYGMEAYLVDDSRPIAAGATGEKVTDPVVVFSSVTTGRSPHVHKMIELAAIRIEDGKLTDRFYTLIDPKEPIPFTTEQQTGINDEMVVGAPSLGKALYAFLSFSEGAYLAAYDAPYEHAFLEHAVMQTGSTLRSVHVDIPQVAKLLIPDLGKMRFERLAKALRVDCSGTFRAMDRAECMAQVYLKLMDHMREENIEYLRDLNVRNGASVESVLQSPYYHAIVLAKNETGRRNLYTLVSMSHLQYFRKRPRIPKSVLAKYREGLILGSACSAGELYQAILKGASDAEISQIVEFYDYLEVQPTGNNGYLLRDPSSGISSVEDLQKINRKIVKLGDQFHKMVVATCDVHFLNPEDAIYRQIIQVGHGYADEEQPPLYLHTTQEMLDEFSYLGAEKAKEIVVTNPAKVADLCEKISPIHPDKCPPSIPNSEKDLEEICFKTAREKYGDPIPAPVEDRLKRELSSIIGNGYAVMYIIAKELVAKSERDGYLVGSRGSVGSSLAATMSGITEVNPLPPHYYCPACHYSEFDSERVKAFAGRAGADMPDAVCPVCGKPLKKDGFDIPFETFLGFKGDKEPDIDLNFAGEEQGIAQAYTEVIFGKGQTFKAGTIGTVADKSAIGFTKGFFENRGVVKRSCEIQRLAAGCTGIRRTTGQHPGGVIVLPKGMDINWFTPVQHPANDVNSDIITTHFDYHSIDRNLLKLDILGHDDPSMLRTLQDLTGIDPHTIPMDDPDVISLFSSTKALGIEPEQIGGVPLGVLGIPEFGTSFVIGMLLDTKPSSLSELVRISGLSHGTSVWLGNAQELIRSGQATLSTAICTRDDIMLYLIEKGVEPERSFKIMETVRKGKGLTEDMEADMRAQNVPDWYIWSCKQIKYMFPKAHAAAYVTNALRIAYYKVHYPLAYYAAYFSIRSGGFSYEMMAQGPERLQHHIEEYEQKESTTATQDDVLRDMYIAREMYARGLRFTRMDLYKAGAVNFKIIDGEIMPALNSIEGLGDTAAESIAAAAAKGPFLSKDDFRTRARASKTITDTLYRLGILGQLPESNQISLFDSGFSF